MSNSGASPRATFIEVHGALEGRGGGGVTGDIVMLTNIQRGCGSSRPRNGLTLRYVARGEERYTIGGKTFRLAEGQLMLAHQNDGAEIDIRKIEPKGTLGLCAFLASDDGHELGELAGPIVLGGPCSTIGTLMKLTLGNLLRPVPGKPEQAMALAHALRRDLPTLLAELARQAEAVQASKPATRLEAIRRVNVARAYLHSETGRIVNLDELATVAGTSRFHLLRTFQQCVGATPAVYHRRLRLRLALDASRSRGLPLDSIADEFGFAGASGLSHAHRRTYGQSPIWNRLERAIDRA